MQPIYGRVAVALCLICAVSAFPASGRPHSDEVELVDKVSTGPIITRGSVFDQVPYFRVATSQDTDDFDVDAILTPASTDSIFDFNFGLLNRAQEILRNLYAQANIGSSLNPSLNISDVSPTLEDSDADGDDGKPHTTSTVKILNGHKYVINETVSRRNSPFGVSVFKVRTVDILPLDDADNADGETTSTSEATVDTVSTTTTTEATTVGVDVTRKEATEAEEMERGSPEVLDPDHRRNEISHRNKQDRIEVLQL